MRDTRESRLLLVLLIAIAFALITVDIRGGEDSPVDGARQAAAAVFGPVEDGVATVVDPVGDAVSAVRDSGERHDRLATLEKENAALKARLGSDDRNRSRLGQLDKMLKSAGAGQYGIKGAEVIAIGAAQGFSWTVTIDIGANDGVKRDMTVLNGKAKVQKGDRLVTFGSQADKPFVPGVPVGVVSRVDPSGGDLTRTIYVTPFVGFTKLDIVGVVVEAPRTDPRDTVLPAKPKPTPTPTVTVTVTPSAPAADGQYQQEQ